MDCTILFSYNVSEEINQRRMICMRIGKRLSELRKKHGFTQEQLADRLGTTRQAVSKWESEKSNPDLDYVIQMGKIFGVSMDYLLLGTEPAFPDPKSSNVNNSQNGVPAPKRRKTAYLLSLCFGALILLLCPLFATLYRNHISGYAPALTDPYLYLNQWPLLGVKLLGILSSITGAAGLAWPLLLGTYHQVCKNWKE